MPDVPIRDFLPLVLQHAPSLPVPIAIEHVRQAAIAFCEQTRCWRKKVVIAVTTNPTAIPLPVNAVVYQIESAYFEDVTDPLRPAAFDDFTDAAYAEVAADSPPEHYTQGNLDEIIIMPLKAGDLTLNLFLKPPSGVVFGGDPDRNTLPDFMLSHHAMFLAYGALASALILPDPAFADAKRAVHFQKMFDARIDAIRSDFRSGQQRRRARTRLSPFM